MPTSKSPRSEPLVGPLPTAVERSTPESAVLSAYLDHHEELYGFLFSSTRDRDAAEDLLQEVFLRLLREARSGRVPEAIRPWLYRVASNMVIDRGRRIATGRRWLARLAPSGTEEPADRPIMWREMAEDVERALAHVSPEARVALLMSGHGFSGEEIAAAIGRSHLATRSLMSRARVTLRREFEAEGRPM